MTYLLYFIFALLPSIIWLLFYLRKDARPESNPMILKIFFWGMFIAIPTFFIELAIFQVTAKVPLPHFLIFLFNIFIGVALVEEFLKYLVVREKVLPSSELDEPLDVMLYMIIAALGFAASENILRFFSPEMLRLSLPETLAMALLIFISTIFFHALVSGTFGFFLALGFFETKKRLKLFATGLAIATFLHGLYNFSIMKIAGYLKFILLLIIIAGLAIFVSLGLQRLKKMKSVCKIITK